MPRTFSHDYIMDILLEEDPWLNATTGCTHPWKELPDIHPTVINKTLAAQRPLVDYIGEYGNFIFGNISIRLDETDNLLRLKYGIVECILHPAVTKDFFQCEVIGAMWFSQMDPNSVNFLSSQSDDFIDAVIVQGLEPEAPPMFILDLEMRNAGKENGGKDENCSSGAETSSAFEACVLFTALVFLVSAIHFPDESSGRLKLKYSV